MKFTKEHRTRYGKKVWGFRGRIGGDRVQLFGFDTREDAERAADDLRRQAIERKYGITPPRSPVTLAEAVGSRLKDLDPAKRNHRRAKVVLEKFAGRFPEGHEVERLTTQDFRDYLADRRGENRDLSNRSLNQELIILSAMLHAAQAAFPPLERWRSPRLPYLLESRRGRERVVTDEEAAKLLSALRGPRLPREQSLARENRLTAADLFQAALLTGARLNELRLLRRDQIDFAGGHVTVRASKTERTNPTRLIPMVASLGELLGRRCASGRSEFVFVNATGGNAVSEYALRRAFAAAAKRAGVAWGRKGGGFTFHTARHTATTAILHAGADLSTVMDVIGHSQKTMTLRYGHATLESRRRAVLALEKYGEIEDAATKRPRKKEVAD